MKLENMGRRTASVFPLPVGAIRRTFSPCRMDGMALLCGAVGSKNSRLTKASPTGLASRLKTLGEDFSSLDISDALHNYFLSNLIILSN
jgi:hypothetical protein